MKISHKKEEIISLEINLTLDKEEIRVLRNFLGGMSQNDQDQILNKSLGKSKPSDESTLDNILSEIRRVFDTEGITKDFS